MCGCGNGFILANDGFTCDPSKCLIYRLLFFFFSFLKIYRNFIGNKWISVEESGMR